MMLREAARAAQREALVHAAVEALEERGLARLSVRDVGRRVGASSMAVYSLFGSKDDLIDAVFDDALAKLAQRYVEAAKDISNPLPRLMALAGAYRKFASDERPRFELVLSCLTFGRGYAKRLRESPAFVVLDGVVADGIAMGLLKGPARVTADLLWAGVHGFVDLELAGAFSKAEAQKRWTALGASLLAGLSSR